MRHHFFFWSVAASTIVATITSLSTNPKNALTKNPSFVIIGGTGRIGTAVASHLLHRLPNASVTLTGRDEYRGRSAVAEVLAENPNTSDSDVRYRRLDYRDPSRLKTLIAGTTGVIHVAGPYADEEPLPLRAAIECRCPVYVDVSDPLDFIDESLSLSPLAVTSGTSCLVAAGAFPGLSNVLAVEAASALPGGDDPSVRDVSFNYFTAGLGGSGEVNLYITNLGFGEDVALYDKGKLTFVEGLAGRILGDVDFSAGDMNYGIGRKKVFAWPFPEAATVARELGISGDSSVAMGTAPDIWNVMLGLLVTVVPRKWWQNRNFSKFMADFSQPLVALTDYLLKISSSDNVGETHAMRIDVVGADEDGSRVTIVQAHESFRRCVGQSCAEFTIDLLNHPRPGVFLPEQRYRDDEARGRIVGKLVSTEGTIGYTGPTLAE